MFVHVLSDFSTAGFAALLWNTSVLQIPLCLHRTKWQTCQNESPGTQWLGKSPEIWMLLFQALSPPDLGRDLETLLSCNTDRFPKYPSATFSGSLVLSDSSCGEVGCEIYEMGT